MRQAVVMGCGAIGLPLAVALASRGARVLGVDIDEDRVARLSRGESGMSEAGLAPALAAALASGALTFSTTPAASARARAWIIAVPTPAGPDLRLDDRAVRSAMATVLAHAAAGDLVVLRSTAPVGLTRALAKEADGRALLFAACPDRSLSGVALADQFSIPSIVGGLGAPDADAAAELLAPLGPVVRVASPEAAEALKLFTNVWRDARFALANQFALYCSAAGLDFAEIRQAGAHGFPRFDIPRAGPVGGPCLDKDVHLLVQSMEAAGVAAPMLREARAVNLSLADHVVARAVADAGENRSVAVLGLAFKGAPETADRRGSVGVAILEKLRTELGAGRVVGWDPGEGHAPAAIGGAGVVILANDHPALASPEVMDACAPAALFYDLCALLPPQARQGRRVIRLGAEGAE